MLRRDKFDIFIGKDDLKDCGGPERPWGYDDEFVFERANLELDKIGHQPFLAYLLTVSNHAPYQLPDERHEIYTIDDNPEYKFLNSLRYSDWALGEFMHRASQSSYFDSTLFVITADHTHHTKLDIYENQHIPFLIYAPRILSPEVRSVIGSQIDILPTIAGLLELPYTASMGRDLRTVPENQGFAYWLSGQGIGWIEGDYIATMGTDDRMPLVYDYRQGDFVGNLADTDSILAVSIRDRALAFCQFSSDLLAGNRIFPAAWLDGPPAGSVDGR
jgi:phosphoglycerol transferase MdoB-like AlkP superfamily enzyme